MTEAAKVSTKIATAILSFIKPSSGRIRSSVPASLRSVESRTKMLRSDGWSWLSRSPCVAGLGSAGRNRSGGCSDARPPFPRDVRHGQERYVSGSRGGVPVAEPPQPHRRQSRGRRGGSVHAGEMDRRGLGYWRHDLQRVDSEDVQAWRSDHGGGSSEYGWLQPRVALLRDQGRRDTALPRGAS